MVRLFTLLIAFYWLQMPRLSNSQKQRQDALDKAHDNAPKKLKVAPNRPILWSNEGVAAFDEKWCGFETTYPQIAQHL
jgi:hypothetical protein